jgi:hypothetical protein
MFGWMSLNIRIRDKCYSFYFQLLLIKEYSLNSTRYFFCGSKFACFFLNLILLPVTENFREHFPTEAADHSCGDAYQVVRKTVELFRENGSVE